MDKRHSYIVRYGGFTEDTKARNATEAKRFAAHALRNHMQWWHKTIAEIMKGMKAYRR